MVRVHKFAKHLQLLLLHLLHLLPFQEALRYVLTQQKAPIPLQRLPMQAIIFGQLQAMPHWFRVREQPLQHSVSNRLTQPEAFRLDRAIALELAQPEP